MRRASIVSPLACALTMAALLPSSAAAQAPVTITVDTTSNVVDFAGAQTVADLPGPDGLTSLREAAIASTNTTGPETIAFDIPTTDPGFTGEEFVIVIDPDPVPQRVAYGLHVGDDATTIDATTQPGGFPIVVEGGPQSTTDPDGGLRITSSGNQVIGLGVRGYANGIDVDGGSNNRIVDVTATGNANGIIFAGTTDSEVSGSTIRDSLRPGIVVTSGSSDTVIDGSTITGNGNSGVFILGSDEITVTGNTISDNGLFGIDFRSEADVFGFPDPATVGGMAAGNTITGNGASGIGVGAADRFTITRNAISGNARLGIDLGSDKQDETGVSRNDGSNDRDQGGNQVLNFPERLSATDDGTATTVEGRVDSRDPQTVIELFANAAADPTGFGEGETFLATATPDAKGRFTATLPAGLAGQWLTATATDPLGNTSEFSEAVQVDVPRR
jgi:parallel beta-helix repeat protein